MYSGTLTNGTIKYKIYFSPPNQDSFFVTYFYNIPPKGDIILTNYEDPDFKNITTGILRDYPSLNQGRIITARINSDDPRTDVYTVVYELPDGSQYTIVIRQDKITKATSMEMRQTGQAKIFGERPVTNLSSTQITQIFNSLISSGQIPPGSILTNATINTDNPSQTTYRFWYTRPDGSQYLITVTTTTTTITITNSTQTSPPTAQGNR